jgi:hypothetical protein
MLPAWSHRAQVQSQKGIESVMTSSLPCLRPEIRCIPASGTGRELLCRLVVLDDKWQASILGPTPQSAGYDLCPAPTGKQALRDFPLAPPDLRLRRRRLLYEAVCSRGTAGEASGGFTKGFWHPTRRSLHRRLPHAFSARSRKPVPDRYGSRRRLQAGDRFGRDRHADGISLLNHTCTQSSSRKQMTK